MAKSIFSKLAFVTMIGATPIVVFTGELADAARPIRANSTSATLYVSPDLAGALGFQKDLNLPTVNIGLADVDPRLVKSTDKAYALVDYDDAIVMLKEFKNIISLADKDTVLVDPDGYDIIVLDAETLRTDAAYAELIDSEIDDDTVLILVVGAGAVQTLRGLGIKEAKLVLGDDAIDVFDTFAEFTLGLTPDTDGGDMPGAGKTSTLGASQPELAAS